jgi:hypothetical protein
MRLLLATAAVVLLLPAAASAAPVSDPQGDVVDRSPCECSNYGQDLKSVDAVVSGSDVVWTIAQYDSMNNQFAASYYGPQVVIYTNGSATPTYAILGRGGGVNQFAMTLVSAAGFVAPCGSQRPGEIASANATYDAAFTTATYTVSLANLGNPSSLQWKVANPGVPNCGPEPDSEATDIAPDNGALVTLSTAGSGGGGGTNNPPPGGGTTTPTPLTPAQTLSSLTGVPGSQALDSTLDGSLTLAGPADSVTIDAVPPSGGAAKITLAGHLVKHDVAAGKLTFHLKLKKSVMRRFRKQRTVKMTLRVTVVTADGKSAVRKKTVKLRRKP